MTRHGPVVVDGQVFATEAADRGMGRYVAYLIELLSGLRREVTVTTTSAPASAIARNWSSAVRIHRDSVAEDPMVCTGRLNELLRSLGAEVYVDATPFVGPARYDVEACPVVAVLYDLIPMRHPRDYFGDAGGWPMDRYVNGIARVRKADHVIAISEYVKLHALRYLGVGRSRCTVIVPRVGPEYRARAAHPIGLPAAGKGIVCIQGAHRSKNFPAAIRFLEDLSSEAGRDVEVIAPTPSQREVIDGARRPGFDRVRVSTAIGEDRKIALQQEASAAIHLSVDEGYGIPLAEALCLGVPVVCIDNPINRELLGGCDDPLAAGILLLHDPTLQSDDDLRAAARFCGHAARPADNPGRARLIRELLGQYAAAEGRIGRALESATSEYRAWHRNAGLAIAAPTEVGSCGVSDYCYALMRGAPRCVLLLGEAPRALQLQPQLRLLPLELADRIRSRYGLLLNLAVSTSLVRGFDAIAEGSSPRDVLVVHDAGSYLPGLMMQAAQHGDDRQLFHRYLQDEPSDVHRMVKEWLTEPRADSDQLFLEIDRRFRSEWLRAFRGAIVSHHPAFSGTSDPTARAALTLLAEGSEIRRRARYVPMPIDARYRPSLVRLAERLRWALDASRFEFIVCCAGSIVGGKHLDVVGRVVARMAAERELAGAAGGLILLLAGQVLDARIFAGVREQFEARGQAHRLVQIVEPNDARYDGLLLASDALVAFREQRRIQMSHSYVRALSLGRPMITNAGSGFDDQDAALVCRDDHLEDDLRAHLSALRASITARHRFAHLSQQRFRARHDVGDFFHAVESPNDDLVTVQAD